MKLQIESGPYLVGEGEAGDGDDEGGNGDDEGENSEDLGFQILVLASDSMVK